MYTRLVVYWFFLLTLVTQGVISVEAPKNGKSFCCAFKSKLKKPPLVHYLEQDEVYVHNTSPYSSRQLEIFCYEGRPKYVIHIWQSVMV